LARLQAGKGGDGATVLRAIYEWFQEGFETPPGSPFLKTGARFSKKTRSASRESSKLASSFQVVLGLKAAPDAHALQGVHGIFGELHGYGTVGRNVGRERTGCRHAPFVVATAPADRV
jgi:hypothetical protein